MSPQPNNISDLKEDREKESSLFEDFFFSSSDFMLLLSSELEVIKINDSGIKLVKGRRSNKKIIGESIKDLNLGFTDKDFILFLEVFEKDLNKSILKNIQVEKHLFQTFRIQIFRVKENIGLIGHNSSKSIRIQDKLIENERLFELIYNTIPNELIIHDLDGNIIYVNEFAINNLGYSKNEFLSLNIEKLNPNIGINSLKEKYWLKVEEREYLRYKSTQYRKSGISYPVEIILTAFFYNTQKIIVEIIKDLTKMKLNEIWYEKILDSSPNAIFLLDMDGIIINCNPQALKMLNFSTKLELVGKHYKNIMLSKDYVKALQNQQEIIKSGVKKNIHFTLERKNGEKFPVEVSASIIHDYNQNPLGFMVISQDISQRVKLEKVKLLQEKEESILFMANNVAHDFNNILMVIMGNLGILEKEHFDQKSESLIEEIYNAIKKAKKITNQLASIGNSDPKPSPVIKPKNQNKSAKNTNSKRKILIMEDNIEIQKVIKKILTYLNVEVVIAKNGTECINKYKNALQTDPFDGIIMDYIIINGMGAEQAIKTILELNPEEKVILSSGNYIYNYRSLGFIDQLQKPYSIKEIKKKIDLFY